jgi:hypothetical protein
MFALAKVLHVLAVGLWFGSIVFFTYVGLSLFDTFEQETAKPAGERPFWLPAPPQLEKTPPSLRFPSPLLKEQGGRLFGSAVGPMFLPYFLLQLGCGAVGLVTALAFLRRGGLHKIRLALLALAIAGAAAGWWLDGEVEHLRHARSDTSDAVLLSASPSAELVSAADQARATFATWHGYSLLANFVTLILVTTAMATAAFLPGRAVPESGA